jgi:flagellar biosynthesis anti-sigma factor FlgM
MSHIDGIQGPGNLRPIQPAQPSRAAPIRPQQAPDRANDTVEISQVASLLAKVEDIPEVRAEKIAAIRAQIEAGTYITPEKIDITAERLLREL